MTRPRLLDLFCGAGGCSVGYHRAGFEVVGVDLHPQPNYPYEFIQGDALSYLNVWLALRDRGFDDFDAIHASPPCQAYSTLRHAAEHKRDSYPDLIPETRRLLQATGLPYVIENVPNAPMRRDYILCGSMFGLEVECRDGKRRQLRRHRWFETNWPVGLQPACDHQGQPVGVYGTGGGGQMTRGYKATLAEARDAMGTPWMNRAEVSQAIPPRYCEFIGAALMAHLNSSIPGL